MPETETAQTDDWVTTAARALEAVAPSLPELRTLEREIADGHAAAARGYFLPDEDERVRMAFGRYLGVRAALFEVLDELRPRLGFGITAPGVIGDNEEEIRAFAIALCAACMLVRSARFIVDNYSEAQVVWRKLDEPESRYGIPGDQYTTVFRSLTRPAHVVPYLQALRFAQRNAHRLAALEADEAMAPIMALLEVELPLAAEIRRRAFVADRLRYWRHAFLRRGKVGAHQVTFALLEVSGRVVAEMRNQFRRKRVTPTIRRRLLKILRPGDVIVTRHDDAMSNLFLPGFWPHAALFIGSVEERRSLGVPIVPGSDGAINVLEARKDGVLFRELDDTLEVDACCVIRPMIGEAEIAEGLRRAQSHAGKLYDFEFDFSRSARLVCTEVVYRGFHGVGGIEFALSRRAGRLCLSAEQLLDRAVEGTGFEPVAVYGTTGRNYLTGGPARAALIASYRPR